MKIARVLVVEDESAIAELISINLRHNGMLPLLAADGEAAQKHIDEVLPDVILLDWMLPGQSGLELARRWRADPRTISASLDLLFIAKAIERIGDHAKNIAEFIIYIVKGEDVRHTPLADVESSMS